MVTRVHVKYNAFFAVLRIGIVLIWYDYVLYLNSHIYCTVVCFRAIQEGVYLGKE